MTIIEILKAVSGCLDGPPMFIHGTESYHNLVSDNINLDNKVVYVDEPIISDDDLKQGGYYEERYDVKMLFLGRSQLDWNSEQQQEIISQCRALRKKFIHELEKNEDVRFIDNIRTTDVMNVLDVNLSGCMVTLYVTPLNPEGYCE